MHHAGSTLIVPIAHDLDYEGSEVVCGTGTKLACDHALMLAEHTVYGYLFVSATKAPRYGNVVMGRVMEDYLRSHGASLRIIFSEAPYFNTLGEVLAVAGYIRRCQSFDGPQAVHKVAFAVKDWHAERVRALAREVFDHYSLAVEICIKPHEAPGRFIEKCLEPLKTQRQIKFFREVHTRKDAVIA